MISATMSDEIVKAVDETPAECEQEVQEPDISLESILILITVIYFP